jgi:hypothetical protein
MEGSRLRQVFDRATATPLQIWMQEYLDSRGWRKQIGENIGKTSQNGKCRKAAGKKKPNSWKKKELDTSLEPRKSLTWDDGRKKQQSSLLVGIIKDTYGWINQ